MYFFYPQIETRIEKHSNLNVTTEFCGIVETVGT